MWGSNEIMYDNVWKRFLIVIFIIDYEVVQHQCVQIHFRVEAKMYILFGICWADMKQRNCLIFKSVFQIFLHSIVAEAVVPFYTE